MATKVRACQFRYSHLCDPQASPLILPQQLQRPSGSVEVVLWYGLEHLLGELHVAVFEVVIAVSVCRARQYLHVTSHLHIMCHEVLCLCNVPRRVVYRINKLVQLVPLRVREKTRLLVATRVVDIQSRHLVLVFLLVTLLHDRLFWRICLRVCMTLGGADGAVRRSAAAGCRVQCWRTGFRRVVDGRRYVV